MQISLRGPLDLLPSFSSPTSATDSLCAKRIRDLLDTAADRFDLTVLQKCESTNSILLNRQPQEDGRAHVVASELQTAGRGRRGRAWQAWPGSSLTFSVLWRFEVGAPVPAGLSLVVGVAVARAVEHLGIVGVQLKWPNDLLIYGDKLAGILVELTQVRGHPPAAVIGIGMNVKLPPDAVIAEQPGVTDLASHLPALPGRNHVLAAILHELSLHLDTYAASGFAALRDEWEQRNAFARLPVRISGEGLDLVGQCIGVDDDGALLLDTGEDTLRVLSGEVSLRVA